MSDEIPTAADQPTSSADDGATTGAATDTERHAPAVQGHDPAVPEAYAAFMRTGWGDRELDLPPHPISDWAQARRDRLAEQFPGERLVVPAGGFKVRSNDTDYRFRPETAHTYLCGNQTSDATGQLARLCVDFGLEASLVGATAEAAAVLRAGLAAGVAPHERRS